MESEIRKAAFQHVNALAASLSLPVYWPNVSISGNPADQHIRVSVLNVEPEVLTTEGGSRHQWILQLSVYVRDGVGEIVPADYASSLQAGLPFNTKLQSINYQYQTTKPGQVISPLKTDGWYIVPVQFRLQTIN